MKYLYHGIINTF